MLPWDVDVLSSGPRLRPLNPSLLSLTFSSLPFPFRCFPINLTSLSWALYSFLDYSIWRLFRCFFQGLFLCDFIYSCVRKVALPAETTGEDADDLKGNLFV